MRPFLARLKDRTSSTRALSSGILVLVMSLGLPIHAAAQFTLTGQFVEQIPGGGIPDFYRFSLGRVHADGITSNVTSVQSCVGAATTDCVQPDGRFTVSNLESGLYIISFRIFGNNVAHMNKFVSASVSGNTDIGVIPLIRKPFDLEMTMGQIPSSGGPIPLTVRVKARWDIPTLPVTLRLHLTQEDVNGIADVELPTRIDFTWPAGLADSGIVALPPINVRASAPAGARSCVEMTIVLRGQPDVLLGDATACEGKQP